MKPIEIYYLLSLLTMSSAAMADSYSMRMNIKNVFGNNTPQGAVESLSCGARHCYLINEGQLWSLGINDNGQLGIGSKTNDFTWQDTGLTNVAAVYAGNDSGYAIIDGVVWSAGNNKYGQLGRSGDNTIFQPTSL